MNGKVTRRGIWMGTDADRTKELPDCEPFSGTSKYHCVWGDTECKNAFFRRFSCYCKPCYEDLVSGGDFQKCLTLPKKPTAPERQADAAAYAGKLKEGSWVAVDCTGGTDVHGFWLAQCIAKPYKASADINAPVGMKDIKKGWPVVDVQWWERYDDDDDDTLFQREGIDDTVHMESLIAVDAPLRRCLGIPAPAGQWTGRLLQTTCATTLAALIKYAHLPGFYQIPTGWPPCNPTAPSTNKQLLSSPTRRAYQLTVHIHIHIILIVDRRRTS